MTSYRMKYKIGATQYHIPVVDDMASFGSGIPLGIILPYSANTLNPPEGFLFCDGSAISRAMYPDLFALIGITYGEGDGSTTFNLPDLTDKFIEGSDTAGTEYEAGLPNIEGDFGAARPRGVNNTLAPSGAIVGDSSTSVAAGSGIAPIALGFNASLSNAIYGNSNTVQPPALTMRYIIKAFSATTSSSELIDITQYASALNQKLTENDIYGNNFTIVYPNNGTAQNPAGVVANSSYVEPNPFPGYRVYCEAELLAGGKWGEIGWATSNNGGGS